MHEQLSSGELRRESSSQNGGNKLNAQRPCWVGRGLRAVVVDVRGGLRDLDAWLSPFLDVMGRKKCSVSWRSPSLRTILATASVRWQNRPDTAPHPDGPTPPPQQRSSPLSSPQLVPRCGEAERATSLRE